MVRARLQFPDDLEFLARTIVLDREEGHQVMAQALGKSRKSARDIMRKDGTQALLRSPISRRNKDTL